MFSELPKIVDRKFLVAHVLPAGLFLAGAAFVLTEMEFLHGTAVTTLTTSNPWLGLGIATVAAWLFGLLLLAANRLLMRLKEGYGLLNVRWSPLLLLQRYRFRRLQGQFEPLKQRRDSLRGFENDELRKVQDKLNRVALDLTEKYPDQERLVLPTSFGNAMRAFETYPRVMYGVEAIHLWNHLLAIVPTEYREFMDEDRAQLNFWLNIWFLGWIFGISYLFLASQLHHGTNYLLLLVVFAVSLFASYWARSSAIRWGKKVRAAFDLYLPDLAKKVDLPTAQSPEHAYQLWQLYSRATLYRWPPALREIRDRSEGG